jgi:hypothetical protein
MRMQPISFYRLEQGTLSAHKRQLTTSENTRAIFVAGAAEVADTYGAMMANSAPPTDLDSARLKIKRRAAAVAAIRMQSAQDETESE